LEFADQSVERQVEVPDFLGSFGPDRNKPELQDTKRCRLPHSLQRQNTDSKQ
jgi:hypothetical protein